MEGVGMKPLLFFDLETQPDFSRIDAFGLPALAPYTETPADQLPDPGDFLAKSLDEMAATDLRPSQEWCAEVRKLELAAGKKARKGALSVIDKLADIRTVYEREEAERIKVLSVTPEYCSIAAFGFAEGEGEPHSMVVGKQVAYESDDIPPYDERDILDHFWSLAHKHTLVGYNIIGFDIPVILARSAILRVRPSCKIETTPWKPGAAIDLYAARFPKGNFGGKGPGKLKELAKLYGLVTQAEDVDGSHVYKLMQEKRFAEVAKYVESDVSLCQQMYEVFRGLFI